MAQQATHSTTIVVVVYMKVATPPGLVSPTDGASIVLSLAHFGNLLNGDAV